MNILVVLWFKSTCTILKIKGCTLTKYQQSRKNDYTLMHKVPKLIKLFHLFMIRKSFFNLLFYFCGYKSTQQLFAGGLCNKIITS